MKSDQSDQIGSDKSKQIGLELKISDKTEQIGREVKYQKCLKGLQDTRRHGEEIF